MRKRLSIIKIFLSSVSICFAGDPLRSIGEQNFCNGKQKFTICDHLGAKFCMEDQCVSVCSALNQELEKFNQCVCTEDKTNVDEGQGKPCSICCESYKRGCSKIGDIATIENSKLSGTQMDFCMDQCPWQSSGKVCEIFNDVGNYTVGMCHRWKCRHPCEIISSNLVACPAGEGQCKQISARFCCREKDEGTEKCRVEDAWSSRLRRRIETNSGKGGLFASVFMVTCAGIFAQM